jgi:hypothetical protein
VARDWKARGAEFLTPPKQHETEIRCYIRDPDGYIIEVGQTTLERGGAHLPEGQVGSARWVFIIGSMSSQRVPGGVVHRLPADLRRELIANATALDAWEDITPLARNEFICWVEDAKRETTRERRIRRTREELVEGRRRPCCWPGCKHRDRTGR